MSRTMRFWCGWLVLILGCLCSQAPWAGHRNLSAAAVPPCPRAVPYCHQNTTPAVRVQGALLQAAALSVAVGPGHQQQMGRRQVRALSGRSRARLPAWYRRAQSAQRLGQTPAVAVARPAHQSQARRRVRAPPDASAGSEGASVRKAARQKRAVDASSVARPAFAAVHNGVRFASESRGARRRRQLQESSSSEWASSHEDSRQQASDDGVATGASTVGPRSAAVTLPAVEPASTGGAVLVGQTASHVVPRSTVSSTQFPEPTPHPVLSGRVFGSSSDSNVLGDESGDMLECRVCKACEPGSFFCGSGCNDQEEHRIEATRGKNWSHEYCLQQSSNGACSQYCYPVEVCHYAGEKFHSLILTEATKDRWLLVTLRLRNTTDSAWMSRRTQGSASELPEPSCRNASELSEVTYFNASGLDLGAGLNAGNASELSESDYCNISAIADSDRKCPETGAGALRGEFRLLSLYHPGAIPGRGPLGDLKRWTRGSWSLGEQLYIGDAPPDNASVRALMASNGTLYQAYVFSKASDDKSRYLRWSSFPPQHEEQFWQNSWPPASFAYSGHDWQLPPAHRLMLLSEEEDGINVWLMCEKDGAVRRWSLESPKARTDEAGQAFSCTQSFIPAADVGPVVALARHGNWLYSVHKTEGEDWQLRRWNIMGGQQDETWRYQLSANLTLSDPRLIANAHESSLYLVPDGGLPYKNGGSFGAWQLVLPATIPPHGECRKWRTVSLGVVNLSLADATEEVARLVCPAPSSSLSLSLLPVSSSAAPGASQQPSRPALPLPPLNDSFYVFLAVGGLVPAAAIVCCAGACMCQYCCKRRTTDSTEELQSKEEEETVALQVLNKAEGAAVAPGAAVDLPQSDTRFGGDNPSADNSFDVELEPEAGGRALPWRELESDLAGRLSTLAVIREESAGVESSSLSEKVDPSSAEAASRPVSDAGLPQAAAAKLLAADD